MRTLGKKESQAYRLRMDDDTLAAIKGAIAWFEKRNLEYSQSCIVRAAIRNYLEHLQDAPESDFSKIAGAVEVASGVTHRRRV